MSAVIISILVVLVIIIVVAAAVVFTSDKPPRSGREIVIYDPNTILAELSTPRQGTPDGRMVFVADTVDAYKCHTWCELDPDCLGYTHVGNIGNEWANQCYFVKNHSRGVATGSK